MPAAMDGSDFSRRAGSGRMLPGMKRVVLVAVLVACRSSGADDYPTRPDPGGPSSVGPGTGGTNPDGGIDANGDAGIVLSGRVCLVSDMRKLTTCAKTGADGFTVTLGVPGAASPSTAKTADDGGFQIVTPLSTGLVWHVTGTGGVDSLAIEESIMALGAENLIPAISVDDYEALLVNNGLPKPLPTDQGSVVVRVVNGVAPVDNIAATAVSPQPISDNGVHYDGDNSQTWLDVETHDNGVVWIASIPAPTTIPATTTTATITLGETGVGTKAKVTATVEDQAITFVTVPVAVP